MRVILTLVVVVAMLWGLVMLSWAIAPSDDTFTPVNAATPLHGPDTQDIFCCHP